MKCPFCNREESKVTDSRYQVETNSIRRRRECLGCQNRFTTFETIDLTIQIKKRDGTYEDFDQNKLIKGLQAASHHSKISHDQLMGIVQKITKDLMLSQVREIKAQELGKIVMSHLKKIDIVAYIRFACVYKRFKHIDDLTSAIEALSLQEDLREETSH